MFQLKLAEFWWRNLLGDSSRVGEGEGKEFHLCLFHFYFSFFSAGVRLGTAGCLANWVRAANEESAAAQITRFARLDSHTLLLPYSYSFFYHACFSQKPPLVHLLLHTTVTAFTRDREALLGLQEVRYETPLPSATKNPPPSNFFLCTQTTSTSSPCHLLSLLALLS